MTTNCCAHKPDEFRFRTTWVLFSFNHFQTPRQYLLAYNRKRGSHYSRYHGYAYDGIWVIAKAIDSILKQDDNTLIFDDLRSQKMHDALNDTDFMGVTVWTLLDNL